MPVESFADASVVTRSIERTLANRQVIAEKLGRERSRVAAARSNFDLLHELGSTNTDVARPVVAAPSTRDFDPNTWEGSR